MRGVNCWWSGTVSLTSSGFDSESDGDGDREINAKAQRGVGINIQTAPIFVGESGRAASPFAAGMMKRY